MIDVPDNVLTQFISAGWHPGREVPLSPAVSRDHPAAEILASLGGLRVEPPEDGGPADLTFQELWPDDSILIGWARLLNARLVGIATFDNANGEWYIASDGRVFATSSLNDAFWFLGDSFSEAVERHLWGRRPRPMLRPDQSSVWLYGVRFTAESPEIYQYR